RGAGSCAWLLPAAVTADSSAPRAAVCWSFIVFLRDAMSARRRSRPGDERTKIRAGGRARNVRQTRSPRGSAFRSWRGRVTYRPVSDRLEAGSKHGGCELTVARLAALGALAVALQGCGGEDVTTIGQD